MRRLINLFKKRDGYTLIVIIVVLLVISLMLGLTLTLNFTSRAKALQFDIYRAQALYLAEAGIREVIWRLKYGQAQPPNPLYLDIEFSNWSGQAEVSIRPNYPQQGKMTIKSIGKVPYSTNNTLLKVEREIIVIIDSTTFQIERWEETSLEYIQ